MSTCSKPKVNLDSGNHLFYIRILSGGKSRIHQLRLPDLHSGQTEVPEKPRFSIIQSVSNISIQLTYLIPLKKHETKKKPCFQFNTNKYHKHYSKMKATIVKQFP